MIKKGNKKKEKKKTQKRTFGDDDTDFFYGGDPGWSERRDKILGIIENLSEHVFEAENMKMSKL